MQEEKVLEKVVLSISIEKVGLNFSFTLYSSSFNEYDFYLVTIVDWYQFKIDVEGGGQNWKCLGGKVFLSFWGKIGRHLI